ncbi:MAG: hypothetical protein MJ178_02270 [Treponemataceae bacterium]|nr:hypothetical protein [Treponemataceae bacterium]
MSNEFYTYHFSQEELTEIVTFLRKCEGQLPDKMQSFYAFCESNMYDNLTIDEAENLFL